MTKKRIIVILIVALLLVTVCFGACSTREDVEVYLDWGSYRQTVKVKCGSVVNAQTVPCLDYDFVDGIYNDVSFTKKYFYKRITTPTTLYVKTNTKYPLEKLYFKQIDKEFEDSKVSLAMNKGFKFDSEFQTVIEKQGIKISTVRYSKYEPTGRDDFHQHVTITLTTSGDEEVFKAVAILEQFPQVYMAGPVYVLEVDADPNDEYYQSNDLWGLNGTNGINAPAAWNTTQGSKKVRVGVIDTGIARHTDLNANVTTGWDFYNDTTNTEDEYSHGTHVAGTIGAVGNNGEGVVGINWSVTIVPMKMGQNGDNYSFDAVLDAMDWAIEKWGTSEQIDIINFSVGGFGWNTHLLDKIRDYPGLFVWAVGNDHFNLDNDPNVALFNLPNLISVGAINKNGVKRDSSNYGKTSVDLFAPGGDIYSTVLNNGYEKKSGTSMAAPHVTGVAALLLSQYPNLTAAQLKTIILNNVDKSESLADYCVSGGRLNAYKALKSQEVVVHTHNYNNDYVWVNTKQHNATCDCGATKLQGHAVSAGQSTSPTRFKLCLLCGGRADYGFVQIGPDSEEVIFVTDNGSFILPNGVVVLVDNDIQAYIDGTLRFYDKNTVKQ